NIINLKAMESPKATYDRSRKSERMSPNPTDEAIDRLVTDAVPRSFLLEPTGDLLGRPSHRKPVTDVRPQRAHALDAGQPSAPR
ncbi:MAG: hypothetical protein ACXW3P_07715, partial [Rhodospirillales bacterium]